MSRIAKFATVLTLTAGLVAAAPTSPALAKALPDRIPLPAGSQPEGIAGGPGDTFYAGARTDGAITVGDLRTGATRSLVQGVTGRIAVGMQYDDRSGLLWVAGGTTGAVTAYDGATGAEVYREVVAGSRFLNDVDITKDAVYVTDSRTAELVVVPLRKGQPTAAPSLLPVTGDFVQPAGFGANGIRALPTGELLVVAAGALFAVDPATGVADRVELTGPALTAGDGLELDGRRLYVVFGFSRNSIAVVDLAKGFGSGAVTGELVDSDLDRPTTTTLYKGSLFTVNGRFSVPPTPTTPYDVIRVALR